MKRKRTKGVGYMDSKEGQVKWHNKNAYRKDLIRREEDKAK